MTATLDLEYLNIPVESRETAPLWALEPILTAFCLELNRLVHQGSDLKPGPYMSKHLEMASTLFVARKGTKICGFSLATFLEFDGRLVVFHNATVIDPSARRNHLTFLLNGLHVCRGFLKSRLRPFYSAARTQNPLVLGTMLSSGPYFPRPEASPPAHIRDVGRTVAQFLNPGATFEADVMVQRGAWNKSEGELPPRHRRAEVNQYCDRHLDYSNCDSLIVVGRFSLPMVARVAWRSFGKQLVARRSKV